MLRACFPIFLVLSSLFAPLHAQTPSEYQVKADYLLNFSKFIDWPDDAFSSTDDPFVMGIVGVDPFGKYLDDIVANEKVGHRNMAIRRYNDVQNIIGCQILYISQPGKTEELAKLAKGRSILTVSDEPGFTKAGGIVQFYTDTSGVKVEINTAAAKESNLNISSKLLRIARIAEPDTAQ